jgi:hypothetical protein
MQRIHEEACKVYVNTDFVNEKKRRSYSWLSNL